MEKGKYLLFVLLIQPPYLRPSPPVGVRNIKNMVYIRSVMGGIYDGNALTTPAHIPPLFLPSAVGFHHFRIRSLGIEQAGVLKAHLVMYR